jgi:hypothetical protein
VRQQLPGRVSFHPAISIQDSLPDAVWSPAWAGMLADQGMCDSVCGAGRLVSIFWSLLTKIT